MGVTRGSTAPAHAATRGPPGSLERRLLPTRGHVPQRPRCARHYTERALRHTALLACIFPRARLSQPLPFGNSAFGAPRHTTPHHTTPHHTTPHHTTPHHTTPHHTTPHHTTPHHTTPHHTTPHHTTPHHTTPHHPALERVTALCQRCTTYYTQRAFRHTARLFCVTSVQGIPSSAIW